MPTKKRLKFAGYVRVSTTTQAEHGTHEAQREAITAWAKEHGRDVEWYVDAGLSGKKNLDGPEFRRLLRDLEKHNLTGIVVTALDRLSRDAAGLMLLTQDLAAHGRELISLREGDQRLTTALNATDKLTNGLLALLVEFTHGQTVERMKAGLARYKAAGGKIGRPRKVIDWKKLDPLIKAGASTTLLARLAGVDPRTMYTRLKQREAEKGKAKP